MKRQDLPTWLEESHVRLFAAQTPGILGDQRAAEPLMNANLDDMSVQVRYNAALLLGLLGDVCAIEPLLEALNDEDEEVQSCASMALVRLK